MPPHSGVKEKSLEYGRGHVEDMFFHGKILRAKKRKTFLFLKGGVK